jgi:hypothetical protein
MLERQFPGEAGNRPMCRESAALESIRNVRGLREAGPERED